MNERARLARQRTAAPPAAPASVLQRRPFFAAPRSGEAPRGALPGRGWGPLPGPAAPGPGATGLPPVLRSRMERAASLDLSDVRVHHDSPAPARISALAFARGNEIHLGPGQGEHLAHEARHVVQQRLGRVRATSRLPTGEAANEDPGLEREAREASRRLPVWTVTAAGAGGALAAAAGGIVQGLWATLSGTTTRLNLRSLGETDAGGRALYEDSRTGRRYVLVGPGEVEEYDAGSGSESDNASEESSDSDDEGIGASYRRWDPAARAKSGITVRTPYGYVSAVHKRGAPKIGSQAKVYGNAALGDTYEEYHRGLTEEGTGTDEQIADALLGNKKPGFFTSLQTRAAAMLTATVNLAEEWRKQGAGKLFRGLLRRVKSGAISLKDALLEKFQFSGQGGAKAGRRQVGRLQDLYEEDTPWSDASDEDRDNYEALSDVDEDDFSSDDEVRQRKQLKGRRLFAKKHL